jgi:mRNA-degrading endonuclease toxin of MazEF toxin-antitoxin module
MVTLTDKQLAEIIGKETAVEGRISWQCDDLPEVKIALRALALTAADTDNSFFIDGVMPYWLYLTILAALSPKKVLLNTPNFGPVEIPANVPEGAGRGLVFNAYENEDFTLVQFMTPRHLSVEQLSTIVPPEVNREKGVIIASNAPFWIIGTVALAYANRVRWTACTESSRRAVVAISNDKTTQLGTKIDREVVIAAIKRAAVGPRVQRGEIWLFDFEHGEHPGLVVSLDTRNENCGDILVVPFTSSSLHAKWHLHAPSSMTGLSVLSYAQYSNLSCISKEQLKSSGPIGYATEEFMTEIVRCIRLAVGDTL